METNYQIENICNFAYNGSKKSCKHECVCGETRDDLDCGNIQYTLPNCVKRPTLNYYGVTVALYVLLAILVIGSIDYIRSGGLLSLLDEYDKIETEVNNGTTAISCSARIGSYLVYYLCCLKCCCRSKLPTKLPIKMRITSHPIFIN